jgi:hypothetical protein
MDLAESLTALRRAAQIYQNGGKPVEQWYYEGDSGEVMGPYPTKWLLSWVKNGVLSPKKEVSSTPRGKPHSICDIWGTDSNLANELNLDDLVHAQELVLEQIETSQEG